MEDNSFIFNTQKRLIFSTKMVEEKSVTHDFYVCSHVYVINAIIGCSYDDLYFC